MLCSTALRSLRALTGIFALILLALPLQAAEGVSDTEVRFLQIAAQEGSAAPLGTNMRAGLLAAFDQVNRKGGVHGRKLVLDTIDDGYTPTRSLEALRKALKENNHLALTGPVGTPTMAAMQPVATDQKFPVIGPFTGAGFLRNPELGNIFNIRASYAAEAKSWAQELIDQQGLKRIAILYQDDSFGRAGRDGLVAALSARGLSPVAEGLYMRNTTAVKTALIDIRRSDAQAVALVGAVDAVTRFVQLKNQLGYQPQLISISFGGDALAKTLGPEGTGLIMSQVVPSPRDQNRRLVQNYLEALKTYDAGLQPSFVSMEGYLAGRLTIAALEQSGPSPTRAGFLASLQAMRDISIDDLPMRFSKTDNQGLDQIFLTQLDATGQFVAMPQN